MDAFLEQVKDNNQVSNVRSRDKVLVGVSEDRFCSLHI